MPRLAANLTLMFTEVPFRERPAAAARAGFRAVEFLFPYEHTPAEVAGWLSSARVTNVLFNLPPGDWAAGERGIAALPGREAEFRASVARAIEYARVLGTPALHAMAGVVPPDSSAERCRTVYLENLRYAARELAREGRMLLIEPLNPRDMPGYLLRTQAEAHALREELGEPNVKVQMDFYHAQIVEGDLTTTFRKHAGAVGHVQIAGVPNRDEPDQGEVAYASIFRLLDECGYEGWVGCEYRPRGRTEDGLGWIGRIGGSMEAGCSDPGNAPR